MSGFGVVLGMLATPGEIAPLTFCYAIACGMLITAGGNTLNDYYDAEIDLVNHPKRPIPSGRIRRWTAKMLAVGELLAGLILGRLVNVACGWVALLAVAALVAYERGGLKNSGLPGNVVISLLTGLLFLAGGAAVGDPWPSASLALLAFVASLGREIAKDIEDVAGDTTRRTWPMRVGVRPARLAAAFLFATAALLSPLPYLLETLSIWYLYVVMPANVLFVWIIFALLRSKVGISRWTKGAMLVVLVAFLVGALP
jgi:geranylgeranylglycerol-phosphate geranylgeranyltransferase